MKRAIAVLVFLLIFVMPALGAIGQECSYPGCQHFMPTRTPTIESTSDAPWRPTLTPPISPLQTPVPIYVQISTYHSEQIPAYEQIVLLPETGANYNFVEHLLLCIVLALSFAARKHFLKR